MSDEHSDADRAELRSRAFDAFASEVAVLDEDGVILETNGSWDSFAAENGVSYHQDMVGENYLTVCDADEDASSTEAAQGIRAIIEGTQNTFSFEYPCHTANERHWFMMRARPVEYEGRRVVLVIHTEITERREAELAVEKRNDQLELLTGILGHELRNPMNVAMVQAELLEGDEEQVATIHSSLERMDAIIEDALMLARGTDVETLKPSASKPSPRTPGLTSERRMERCS